MSEAREFDGSHDSLECTIERAGQREPTDSRRDDQILVLQGLAGCEPFRCLRCSAPGSVSSSSGMIRRNRSFSALLHAAPVCVATSLSSILSVPALVSRSSIQAATSSRSSSESWIAPRPFSMCGIAHSYCSRGLTVTGHETANEPTHRAPFARTVLGTSRPGRSEYRALRIERAELSRTMLTRAGIDAVDPPDPTCRVGLRTLG